MAEDDSGEKTEEPTGRRREEYRERGQIARSQDILSLLSLGMGLAYFIFFGRFLFSRFNSIFTAFVGGTWTVDGSIPQMLQLGMKSFYEIAYICAPLFAGVIVFAILGNLLQVGVLFTTKTLEPKLDKLNFFSKFIPTFFNKRAFGNLFTSLVKMFFIMLVVYYTLNGDAKKIVQLPLMPIESGISYLLERIISLLFNIVLIMIVIAVIDYAWQVWMMEQEMKMSKQEVKDEHKMAEGNPQIKSQRRRRALEMFNQRLTSDVPQADVVINNPTHFSVALRYRQGKDVAPIVVAKGADLVALRIRRLAEQHDVTMVDNPTLARALYKQVKVGRAVPLEFYRAVAEILYYVYRLRHGSRLLKRDVVSEE